MSNSTFTAVLNRNELKRPALLLALNGLALGLLLVRFQLTGTQYFLFLVWNLFLAWVPWAVGQALTFRKLPLGFQLPVLGVWMLFFPNAPYILTDLFHLRIRSDIPQWFDLLLILTFAWAGLMWGFASLRKIQRGIFQSWNRWLAPWLSVAVLYLSAYGVYLGRYLRFNSWDLATHPEVILEEAFGFVLQPMVHPQVLGFTLGFGSFLVVAYGIYVASEPNERAISSQKRAIDRP